MIARSIQVNIFSLRDAAEIGPGGRCVFYVVEDRQIGKVYLHLVSDGIIILDPVAAGNGQSVFHDRGRKEVGERILR